MRKIIRIENSKTGESYQVQRFFSEEDQIPAIQASKGFPLRCGIVEKNGKQHFIKFVVIKECTENALKAAREAFEREIRFQMRYPYIVYVENLEIYTLYTENLELENVELDDIEPEDVGGENVEAKETKLEDFEINLTYFLRTIQKLEAKEGTSAAGISILCLMEEYVQGESLEEVYAADAPAVADELMFRHMYQLLNGMCAYYDRYRTDPLLHRDIKPANIMIRADQKTCTYIDFDIAHPSGSKKTQNIGTFGKGTPGYAHPRQTAAGEGKSDIRMDFYGLGMTFLYMLTGTDYMRMATGLSETEMEDWSYLRNPSYFPYLYQVKKEQLFKNGIPVFQEERYNGLLALINQMIADDTRPNSQLVRSPRELLHQFQQYLRSLYGKSYRDLFQDDVLLSKTVKAALNQASIQIYSYQEGARILHLDENRVLSICDDLGKEMLLLYRNGKKVWYQFTCQNLTSVSQGSIAFDAGMKKNLLTAESVDFTIGDRHYRLKLIRIR